MFGPAVTVSEPGVGPRSFDLEGLHCLAKDRQEHIATGFVGSPEEPIVQVRRVDDGLIEEERGRLAGVPSRAGDLNDLASSTESMGRRRLRHASELVI